MTIETELRDKLVIDVPEASSRIYPIKLPQNAAFPAIRYNRTSAVRDYTMTGPDCLPATRFQIDVFAKTFTAVRSAFDSVRKALDGYAGLEIQAIELDNETDDYEDDTELFRVIGDFVIQHNEQL